MTCPRCHNTCMVPVEHNGVRTMDACPTCARRAEAEWVLLSHHFPGAGKDDATWRDEDIATKVAAE